MRSKSTELMSEIKKYIEDYYLQNRQSPSTTKQKSATEQLSEKNALCAKKNIAPYSPAWRSPITPIKKD